MSNSDSTVQINRPEDIPGGVVIKRSTGKGCGQKVCVLGRGEKGYNGRDGFHGGLGEKNCRMDGRTEESCFHRVCLWCKGAPLVSVVDDSGRFLEALGMDG